MPKYRISKYSPKYRDERGRYLKDDWTSYADIGKTFNGEQLTMEEYARIEAYYSKVVKTICEASNVKILRVEELESNFSIKDIVEMFGKKGMELSESDKQFIKHLKNGYLVTLDCLNRCLLLALKDCYWCKLISPTSEFMIEFGYDLYIYITCGEIKKQIIQQAEGIGIYIESI